MQQQSRRQTEKPEQINCMRIHSLEIKQLQNLLEVIWDVNSHWKPIFNLEGSRTGLIAFSFAFGLGSNAL